MTKIGKITNTILTIGFLSIIFTGLLQFHLAKKEELNMAENRKLAERPVFDINNLDPLPSQFDKYFTDHFPYRTRIVTVFNEINLNKFNISPLPDKVMIGLDGYLFMSGTQLETFQGKNLFSESELKSILEELRYRKNFCDNLGAKFYFVIIPQKHTIYNEKIPPRFKLKNEKTLRTQLESYLDTNNFSYIDPTVFIMSKKTEDFPLYFKTDNHWNNLGAFYGSQYIISNIKQDFPQVQSLDLKDYDTEESSGIGGNLAQMLNMQSNFSEIQLIFNPSFTSNAKMGEKKPYPPTEGFGYPDEFEQVFVNPLANNLKAIFIRESYANSQRQFYKESFGKTLLIWDRWQYALNEKILMSERPDIVVIQILESNLTKLLSNQSKIKAEGKN